MLVNVKLALLLEEGIKANTYV